jgi:predicted transcriptional regulator
MNTRITIEITSDLNEQIEALAAADGASSEDWIRHLIESDVFLRRFRAARAEMLRILDGRGITVTEDEVLALPRTI